MASASPDQFKSPADLQRWYEASLMPETPQTGQEPSPITARFPEVPVYLREKLQPCTFQNWSKTVTIEVLKGTPTSVKDVQDIVNYARKENFKVRAVGRTHSFTPIFSNSHQILLHMDGMTLEGQGGKKIVFDPKNMEVTISAGVTVEEAREFLVKNNAYFESFTIVKEVHMIGVAPTASHGTGWDQLSISDFLTKIKVVTSQGEVRTFTDKEDLKSLGVNLGLFGVVTEQTMKVQPMQYVKVFNDFSKTFKDVFEGNSPYLRELYKKDFSLEFFWFPFNSMTCEEIKHLLITGDPGSWNPDNDKMWIRTVNKTDKKKDNSPEERTRDAVQNNVWSETYEIVKQAAGEATKLKLPFHLSLERLVPLMSWVSFNYIIKPYFELSNTLYPSMSIDKAIHFVDPYLSPYTVYDLEMAFDCPPDCDSVLKASTTVKGIVQREAGKGKFPLSGTYEMRFIAGTNCHISPSVVSERRDGIGSGTSAYIEVVPYSFTTDYKKFFAEVAAKWIGIGKEAGRQPIPHWGKGFDSIVDPPAYLRGVYGDKMTQFKQTRTDLNVDPDNMFITNELQEIFQFK